MVFKSDIDKLSTCRLCIDIFRRILYIVSWLFHFTFVHLLQKVQLILSVRRCKELTEGMREKDTPSLCVG